MAIHDLKPGTRAEAPELPPNEPRTIGDKIVLVIVAVACLAAAAIIGYLLLRPIDTPNPPQTSPLADTRAVDEAAALAVVKQLPTANGEDLDKVMTKPLADDLRAIEADWKEQGIREIGTPTLTYKIRDYAATPDTRVVISRCADLSKTSLVDAEGNRVDAPPGGKPLTWTRSLTIVTEQSDGNWLITSDDVTEYGSEGACSLNPPR